ncbi:MAG: hypothetical protein N3A01_04725 [Bacteroidales bacterium]|nr:hypothetical protein [Bacteroidales bacterium]
MGRIIFKNKNLKVKKNKDDLTLITQFIKKHHIFNLSVYDNNELWTATCFYAFWEEQMALIFTTDLDTKHGRMMLNNNSVVGTIALETKIIGKIQGIQFKGTVKIADVNTLNFIKKLYYKRFPVAIGTKSEFWILYFTYIKYTDNTLGFGKKIIWQKENEKN